MRVTQTTNEVVWDILNERHRQFDKFGEHNPLSSGSDAERLAILSEEHGEVAREVCEKLLRQPVDPKDLYKELVQVAAVATGFAEVVRDRLAGEV